MRVLARRLNCDIHAVALGNHDGEAMIEIRPDIQGATLLEDVTPHQIVRRDRVPLRRFDSLFGEIPRPALAKIDVQSAELMVLEGMTGRMASFDALIVETSTISSVKGAAEVHDVMQFMRRHGFVVADVLGMTRRTRRCHCPARPHVPAGRGFSAAPRSALGRNVDRASLAVK
jgi:hypothetical protein